MGTLYLIPGAKGGAFLFSQVLENDQVSETALELLSIF